MDLAAEQLRSQRQNRSWFIPVVFSRGKVPDRVIGPGYNLQDIQWVDLDADWREGVNTLVNVILERLLPDSRQSASDPQTRARLLEAYRSPRRSIDRSDCFCGGPPPRR